MNKLFKNMLDQHGVKFNKDVVGGLSRKYMDGLVDFLDAVIRSAMTTLPPELGLEYHGHRRLTPLEDFYNNINAPVSKNCIDISRSCLFKQEFGFTYHGVPMNRVIAFPYVTKAGYIKLSDANYVFNPVLSEYPISPAPGEVFVRLLRDKLNLKRMDRKILINNECVAKKIIYAKTYKLLSDVNSVIPVALYMFIKHGFYGVYKHYFNTKPLIYSGNVNLSKFEKDYNIYTTTGVKPRTLQTADYIPHDIKILIKKKDVTPFLETVTASLIYSLDMSPQVAMNLLKVAGIKKEPSTNFNYNNIDKESLFWIVLLGKIIFKNKYSIDRIQIDVLEHIDILNGYLDAIIKQKLLEINIDIEDFYELLAWSIDNFDELVMKHEQYSSSLNNRYIDLNYYAMYEFIVAVNKSFLEFKRTASKKRLSEREMNRIFNKYLQVKKLFKIIKGGSGNTNISISPVDYTGDNMYYKMTSLIADQSSANGVIRSKSNAFPPATRTIHGVDAYFGSILFLQKKAPTPRFRLNPFVAVDIPKGKFIIPDKDKRTIAKLDSMFDSKFEDAEITNNEELADISD